MGEMRGTGSLGNQQPILPLLALPPIPRPRSGPAAIPRPVPLPPLLHIAPIPRPRQLPRPRPPPSRLPPPPSPRRLCLASGQKSRPPPPPAAPDGTKCRWSTWRVLALSAIAPDFEPTKTATSSKATPGTTRSASSSRRRLRRPPGRLPAPLSARNPRSSSPQTRSG